MTGDNETLVFHNQLSQDAGDGLWMKPNQSSSRKGSLPVGGEDAVFLDLMNVVQMVGIAEDVVSGLIVNQKWIKQHLGKFGK